jgi:hypothetical protein
MRKTLYDSRPEKNTRRTSVENARNNRGSCTFRVVHSPDSETDCETERRDAGVENGAEDGDCRETGVRSESVRHGKEKD